MWRNVKLNLDSGIEKVKWFSSLFNDRVKTEVSVMKLLYQSTELEKKRADMLKMIGERVFVLKNNPEKHIMNDQTIVSVMSELEKLDIEIEDLKKKASDISRVDV